MAGRRWTVTCAAVPQFVRHENHVVSLGAAAAGLLLTGLLAAYLAGIAKRDAQTTQLAAQLTETTGDWRRKVADRKQAESTLQTSQTKYRTLYDLSSEAIMLVTPEEGFLSGNAAAVALFGCKDEKEFTSHAPPTCRPNASPTAGCRPKKPRR